MELRQDLANVDVLEGVLCQWSARREARVEWFM